MKKLTVFLLAALLMTNIMPATSYAGPWTVKQNSLWMEVFTRYFLAKETFDSDGKKDRWANGGYSEIYDVSAKFEYGVTDDLTFLLEVPYSFAKWKNDFGALEHEGFKEIVVGGKYLFMKKPVVAAVQLKVFIHPAGTDQQLAPDLFEYGDSIEARILLGRTFRINRKLLYVAGEAGYKVRSNWINKSFFANTIPVFVESGFAVFDWLMLKAEVDLSLSHAGTGVRKDTLTWRAGPIFNILGKGFNSITKGSQSSLNIELQIGQTVWGRGDATSERFGLVNSAFEYILKIQALF